VLVKLAGSDTNDAVEVVHPTEPKLAGPPLHRHSGEDEWFYVGGFGIRSAGHMTPAWLERFFEELSVLNEGLTQPDFAG